MNKTNLNSRFIHSPDKFNMDEHIFCEYCCDYVYEYCSIHGPLYVIPDTQPPTRPSLPQYVPRAVLTMPREFLHIARSTIPGAGLGVFATLTLPRGVRFGPHQGQRTKEVKSSYCWQISDLENERALCFEDAEDDTRSNWMRYVNCACHWTEQNLIAFQYQGKIYYKTVKIVPRFSELLVYYGTEYASYLGVDLKNYNSHKPLLKSNIISPSLFNNNNGPNERELMKNRNTSVSANNDDFTSINQTGTDYDTSLNQTSTYYDTFANSKIICNECNKGFESKTSLIEHLKTHQNCISSIGIAYNTNVPYSHSGGSTNNPINEQGELVVHPHAQQINQSKPHSCSICKKTFALKRSLGRHLKNHFEKDQFTCLICLKNLSDKHNLRNHILNVHVMLKRRCLICKGLYNISTIREHMKTQHAQERKKIPCPVCSKQFNSKRAMKKHIDAIHLKVRKMFSCLICQKQYSSSWNVKEHVRITHAQERNVLICPVCSKQFNSKRAMKRHIDTIHAKERKMFSCPICQKQFTSKRGMEQHMDTIHVEERKMFPCPVCRKEYYTKKGMKSHMKTIHVEC